jgi:hypothetical protein
MSTLLAFVLFIATWSSLALERPPLQPELSDLRRFCHLHRTLNKIKGIDSPEVGQIGFFPPSVLMATQSRFSFSRWSNSLEKVVRQNDRTFANKKRWQLPHDHGRSVYGFDKRIHGVFYRGYIYIIDGHHRALVSTYLGSETLPVEVVADWSRLYSPKQFRRELESRGLAYWQDHSGLRSEALDLCELIDDPNLQLARYLIHRVNVDLQFGNFSISKKSGAERPLLLKINQDIPFLEFLVADALRRAGVQFNVRRQESDLRRGELKEYLAILREAAKDPSSPLNRVLLLDSPKDVRKLDLRALILRHLKQNECAALLVNEGTET